MRISIYDMDRTVIARASWTPWLLYYARTEAPLRLLLGPLTLVPLLGYGLGLIGRKGLKQAIQRLLMGAQVPRARVERAAAGFAAVFGARQELRAALASMEQDRAQGCEIWLATASCRYFVEALASRWGIDRVVATENSWIGDALTPRISSENCYEMGKLRMILSALDARPEHVRFTSDHISDLVVLDWADSPVAANPIPALRRVAHARGWPVCDWAADASRKG
ncbi:MAG: HAD family hydrolase [Sandaracinobacteroides sp.]